VPQVKTTFEVTQKDAKLKRLIASIETAKGEVVDVGLLEGTGAAGQIAQYGFFNEFGTKHIPSRSFMRSTFDQHRRKYEQILKKGYDQALAGKIPLRRALYTVGVEAQGDIMLRITNLRSPRNAPSTIRKKGSSNPLIDDGHMRMAISFDVRSK